MQSSEPKYIIIGRVGSAHGVIGENKIISFTDPPSNILKYLPWQLSRHGQHQQVTLTKSRSQNSLLVVQFTGCIDRDQARKYTGADILVDREQLPVLKKGEFYQSDLIGMAVFHVNGEKLGAVTDILETGANDVLVVVDSKRLLIPYILKDVIKNIDLENKIILVEWDTDF